MLFCALFNGFKYPDGTKLCRPLGQVFDGESRILAYRALGRPTMGFLAASVPEVMPELERA